MPAGVRTLERSRRMRAIRADKSAQLRLLDLQTVDTTLAQLDHRRQTLPQHAAITRLQTQRAALASDLVAAETTISDLELEQTKAETDLEPVASGLSRNQVRISNGTVADPEGALLDAGGGQPPQETDQRSRGRRARRDGATGGRGRQSGDRCGLEWTQVDDDLVETVAERDRQLDGAR